MAVLPVITVGDPRLRQRSRPVEHITPEVQRLIDDMIETMHANDGIGLAAVQVGELRQIVVIEVPADEEIAGSGQRYVVINPEIVRASQEEEIGLEGCLSVPGYAGDVARSVSIFVRGLDRRGQKLRLRLNGFMARVFQHEIDHTRGVLYIDRLVAADRIWRVQEGTEEHVEQEGVLPENAPG
ncbi:MAG TPA: peptide deformylase [Anaerolineae bacterium]|nr:peptide deformylase [Anaerolineae bacterium]